MLAERIQFSLPIDRHLLATLHNSFGLLVEAVPDTNKRTIGSDGNFV
jgi:hypothetical protein